MIKKSLLETVSVAPSVKTESVSKLVVLAPDAYLTILETVAPASLLVKVVVSVPVACAVVRVIVPAVSKPRVAFGVPRVGVWPLTDAADKVATSDGSTTFVDVPAVEFPAALIAITENM
jgi:hypothetical protein